MPNYSLDAEGKALRLSLIEAHASGEARSVHSIDALMPLILALDSMEWTQSLSLVRMGFPHAIVGVTTFANAVDVFAESQDYLDWPDRWVNDIIRNIAHDYL